MPSEPTATPGRPAKPPPAPELRRLGKYEIERKLGQGGMGTVYLGRDNALRRTVALKVLPKDKAENPTLVRRFQAEAQAAAKLRHENIVAVYDSDAADGYLYIAMEFVDGQDLYEIVSKRGTIPVKRSIKIIEQVALALQHAHEQHIVHRDIKPSNLLIRRDGVVKLTDLGLARSVDDTIETNITRAGTTVGTVDYMAPEQARNSKLADIRSDMYSLGCTWYFMLTGEPPYSEGSLTNKLQAHAIKPLPDPREINPNVTEGLVAVLHRMMAKKPEARYQTPAELLHDLKTAVLTRNAFSAEIFDEPTDTPPSPAASAPTADPLPNAVPPSKNLSSRAAQKSESRNESETSTARRAPRSTAADERSTPSGKASPRSASPDAPEASPNANAADADDADELPVRRRSPAAAVPDSQQESSEATAPNPRPNSVRLLDDSNDGVATVEKPAISRPVKSREGAALPPPSRTRAESLEDATEESSIDLEWTKIAAVGIGVAVLVGGAAWMVSQFSAGMAFDTPASVKSVEVSPPVYVQSQAVAHAPSMGPSDPADDHANGKTGGTDGQKAPSASQMNNSNVNTVPFDAEKTSEWVQIPTPKLATVITVGPGAPSSTHTSTLAEALRRVGPDGARVQLIGSGPFVLSTPETVATKWLILAADTGAAPVVVIGSAIEGQVGSLRVTGGHLELIGLQLTMDRTAWKSNEPMRTFSIVEGGLTLRDCSITVAGESRVPQTLFSLEGGAAVGTRLLLERTMIRGEPTTAFDLHVNRLEAEVRDSLLAVGAGAILHMTAWNSVGDPGTSQRPPRIWRTVNSTLCSEQSVVDLSGDGGRDKPIFTHLAFFDSVCTTGSSNGPRVLLNAANWFQDPLRDTVAWTSKRSAYLGFDNLIDFGAKSMLRSRTGEAWRQFWQRPAEADQFLSDIWPNRTVDIASLLPQDFDRSLLPPPAARMGRKGEAPGVSAAKLLAPDSTPAARLAAFSRRRTLPSKVTQPSDGAPRRVDLKKEDLGTVLARGDYPSGTVFEVVGHGNCSMTPVQLGNRDIRLIFMQAADGAMPLRLSSKDSAKDAEALFRIEKGTLEIDDLRWQSAEPRNGTPAWLVAANDANVIFRRCELMGPEKSSSPYAGVIRFATAPAVSSEPPYLAIVDSFVQTPGALARVEAGSGMVFVRNSVLVSRGTVFDVQPRPVNGNLPLSFDLLHSTMSAAQSVFQVQAASLPGPALEPVQCFVEGCAVAPPFSLRMGEALESSFVVFNGSEQQLQQFAWWGQSNGISPEVAVLFKSVAAVATDAKAWQAAWGEGHDAQLLTGPGGCMLAEHLPFRREQLKPSSFALHPSGKGVMWAEGRPIGADVRKLDSIIGPQRTRHDQSASGRSANPPATAPTAKPATPKSGGF